MLIPPLGSRTAGLEIDMSHGEYRVTLREGKGFEGFDAVVGLRDAEIGGSVWP